MQVLKQSSYSKVNSLKMLTSRRNQYSLSNCGFLQMSLKGRKFSKNGSAFVARKATGVVTWLVSPALIRHVTRTT